MFWDGKYLDNVLCQTLLACSSAFRVNLSSPLESFSFIMALLARTADFKGGPLSISGVISLVFVSAAVALKSVRNLA